MGLVLQSASRESLARAKERLDSYVDGSSAGDLARLGDDVFGVLRFLMVEPGVRRALADPAVASAARSQLADRLFSGKIGRASLDALSELVSSRWSQSADLLEAVEQLARSAVLGVAEKNGSLDDVEDQLFRFGRILDREPELTTLLDDDNAPTDNRVELLQQVLRDKVSPVTATLLEQTVRTPRSRHLDVVAEELSELAAERRDRSVAHVRTPARLSPQQERRLVESLTRVYGRPISLHVEHDPTLLGGLTVQVGDEVIDGSVSSRIATARRKLPG